MSTFVYFHRILHITSWTLCKISFSLPTRFRFGVFVDVHSVNNREFRIENQTNNNKNNISDSFLYLKIRANITVFWLTHISANWLAFGWWSQNLPFTFTYTYVYKYRRQALYRQLNHWFLFLSFFSFLFFRFFFSLLNLIIHNKFCLK